MSEEEVLHEAQAHTYEEVQQYGDAPAVHLKLEDLLSVKMRLAAELGQSSLRVRDVLGLSVGSVIALDKMAGEMTDLKVNQQTLAKGEVVVIGDVLHVRIAEITGVGKHLDESAGL